MVEPEVAFMDLEGDMELAEDFLVYVVAARARDAPEGARRIARSATLTRCSRACRSPFPRITLRTRRSRSCRRTATPRRKVGDDFGGDEETVISSKFDRPVIVTATRWTLKAFYFKRDPERPELALNMDVLAPEGYGEIIGGGQREDDLARARGAIDAAQAADARRSSGTSTCAATARFPHAGFGLGIERTVAWICGLPHVRETIPFPRMLTACGRDRR